MRRRRQERAAVLMHHLERDLGEYEGGGVVAPQWEPDFSVLQFDDRPEPDVVASVIFGIGKHVLTAHDGSEHAQELLLFLRDADVCARPRSVRPAPADGPVVLRRGRPAARTRRTRR